MALSERPPLTRARVLAAAVELVDANGVEALSMRKLGAALGVEAMSLYNHVRNKDDVVNGILDLVVREVPLPPADDPWVDQLTAIAHGFRQAGHAHPRIFPLIGTRAVPTVEGFRPLEQAYAALRGAGLDADRAMDAFVSLAAYVFGYVLTELGGLVDVADGRHLDLDGLDLSEHVHLVEMGLALQRRDADAQFAFGLDLHLRGLTEMVAGAGPPAA